MSAVVAKDVRNNTSLRAYNSIYSLIIALVTAGEENTSENYSSSIPLTLVHTQSLFPFHRASSVFIGDSCSESPNLPRLPVTSALVRHSPLYSAQLFLNTSQFLLH